MRRRRALTAAACLLMGLGLWQAASGGYIHAKAWLAQGLIDPAGARVQAGEAHARPWPWADTWPVARLELPSLDAALTVLAGGSGRTMAFGPGHVDGSALPGEAGISLIAGHRDTHFRLLEALRVGDDIGIEDSSGLHHSFRVTSFQVVDSRRVRIDPHGDTPRLALSTCYPFDALTTGGPLRYVVFADAVTPGRTHMRPLVARDILDFDTVSPN
jgi:sortase A